MFIRCYQVLLSLPYLSPNDLHAFEEAAAKTTSPKEQKQLIRSLLLLGSGNNLKALAAKKNLNLITNVTGKPGSLHIYDLSFLTEFKTVLLFLAFSKIAPTSKGFRNNWSECFVR